MRRVFLTIAAVCLCAGCGEAGRVTANSNLRSKLFVKQMTAGKTSRDDEQKYIISVDDVLNSVDGNVRTPAKAAATRALVKD